MKDNKYRLYYCDNCKKNTKFYPLTKRKCFSCEFCGKQNYPRAKTIFCKSHLSDTKLDLAIEYLQENRYSGIRDLADVLNVNYRTAWRIRKILVEELFPDHQWRGKGNWRYFQKL